MNPDAIKLPASASPWKLSITGPCVDPFTGKNIPENHTEHHIDFGMTLRDHFAGLAMQADISIPKKYAYDINERARWAYQQADAMIAARES